MKKKLRPEKKKLSRYEELCTAYEKVQSEYKKVEEDCLNFSKLLVKNFVEYFQVPPRLLSYYKISGDNEFNLVLPEMERAIAYANDGYWHFGLGLSILSSYEKANRDLILIHLFVREDPSGKFFTRIAKEPQEFEINQDDDESFTKFFNSIKETVIKSYEEGFQEFIGHHTTRKLGYRIDRS